jgi:hypothetical protein
MELMEELRGKLLGEAAPKPAEKKETKTADEKEQL